MSFFTTDHGYFFRKLLDELTSEVWRSLEKVGEEQCAMTDLERFEYYFDSIWSCQDTTRILDLLKDVIRFRMGISLKFYPPRTNTTSDVNPISTCDEPEPEPTMNNQDSDDVKKPNLCLNLDHLLEREEEPHPTSTCDDAKTLCIDNLFEGEAELHVVSTPDINDILYIH